MQRNAVVLLSGGLDSATALAIAKSQEFQCYALSFRYGQRHAVELNAAAAVAKLLGVFDHKIIDIDLRQFGGSALTADIAVPKNQSLDEIGTGIPITYVPARNTIFLSYAVAWSEVLPASDIFIGVNHLDYSGYPDCRPQFIKAFEDAANFGTRFGEAPTRLRIHAPLIEMSKAEIIRVGSSLRVDYSLTSSCYDPSPLGLACGSCDSCLLRRRGFEDAEVPDPTRYTLEQQK